MGASRHARIINAMSSSSACKLSALPCRAPFTPSGIEGETAMQIDIEVSEAHANELTNLLKKPNGDIADMGPIPFEVIKPLAGVFGDEEGKWTVRLKTSLATAAQIATIVGLIWAHVPTKPEVVPQPPPTRLRSRSQLENPQCTMKPKTPVIQRCWKQRSQITSQRMVRRIRST